LKSLRRRNVTPSDYQKLAMRTEADQAKILDRLTKLGPQAMRLDNAARGLAGDAGEVSSAVMKFIEYGRPLDVTNLLEEVGDCLWRLAQVCQAVSALSGEAFTLERAMEANIKKLAIRYPDKYSDEAAVHRDYEKERAAVEQYPSVDEMQSAQKEIGRQMLTDQERSRHYGKQGAD
jgi:NTP pyrophosphatase (non-canonical NTP hydrolase)